MHSTCGLQFTKEADTSKQSHGIFRLKRGIAQKGCAGMKRFVCYFVMLAIKPHHNFYSGLTQISTILYNTQSSAIFRKVLVAGKLATIFSGKIILPEPFSHFITRISIISCSRLLDPTWAAEKNVSIPWASFTENYALIYTTWEYFVKPHKYSLNPLGKKNTGGEKEFGWFFFKKFHFREPSALSF